MVEKFFLALDYEKPDDIVAKGLGAIDFLENKYSKSFVEKRVGVKINEDMLTGKIDERFKDFKDKRGCSIFADKKISHGSDTGRRIMERLLGQLPTEYVTVSANMGLKVLSEYVQYGNELGLKVIGWTVHTKTPPEDAERIYRQSLGDSIYTLVQIASEAKCDAAVMEASMLKDERIIKLPIKHLVTGIRIDTSDKGTQQRISSLEDVANIKPLVDYAVISSRYLSDFESLEEIISTLK